MRQTDPLALDASCITNLFATCRLRENVAALPYHMLVADYVAEQEALYVRRPSPI